MIISDLYTTKLTLDKYNPIISKDNNLNPVTLTIKLEDFNTGGVKGKQVDVTVNLGYFQSVVGATTTNFNNTTTKSFTATTKTDGTITATYIPSEFGLATFTANGVVVQARVHGFKQVASGNGWTAYEGPDNYMTVIDGSVTFGGTGQWSEVGSSSFETITSTYAPKKEVPLHTGHVTAKATAKANGKITVYKSDTGNVEVKFYGFYTILK